LFQNSDLDCDVCADLCTRNTDFNGSAYNCVAFECTPNLAHPDAPKRAAGPRCELWSMVPKFVGATAYDSAIYQATGQIVPLSASSYWCYTKTTASTSTAASAGALPSSSFAPTVTQLDQNAIALLDTSIGIGGAILTFVLLIFLMVVGMWFRGFHPPPGYATPRTKEILMEGVGPSSDEREAPGKEVLEKASS